MAYVFDYADPVHGFEKFLKVSREGRKRLSDPPAPLQTDWTEDGFCVVSQSATIVLNLLLGPEYLYILALVEQFNRDLPYPIGP